MVLRFCGSVVLWFFPMWLFRRSIDLERAQARQLTINDLGKVSRLLRSGGRRFYALHGTDLGGLVGAGLGAALVLDQELLGVFVASWPSEQTAWLRGVALAEGLDLRQAINLGITGYHRVLRERGLTTSYYVGDDGAEMWLDPVLVEHHYRSSTDVLVYEKRDLLIPAYGNPLIELRSAEPSDLTEVLRVDRRCFEPHWTKDDTILGPAVEHGPFFVVAEWEAEIVGYAYATSHFGGRLVHLVRIAVNPEMQGKGIGVRLLANVVQFARDHGASAVTLNTQAYNQHAQRLYRWFGFTPTGDTQTVYHHDLLQQ